MVNDQQVLAFIIITEDHTQCRSVQCMITTLNRIHMVRFESFFFFFFWLHSILIAAFRIFVAECWIFSCSMWALVPWPGIEPGPAALGARSFNCLILRPPGKSQLWVIFMHVVFSELPLLLIHVYSMMKGWFSRSLLFRYVSLHTDIGSRCGESLKQAWIPLYISVRSSSEESSGLNILLTFMSTRTSEYNLVWK